MRILKPILILVGVGFLALGAAEYGAQRIPEAKLYKYPESVARHYANHGGGKIAFSDGTPVVVHHKFETKSTDGTQAEIETLEVETAALDVEVVPVEEDGIVLDVSSPALNVEQPLLIDQSKPSVLRISTQELGSNSSSGLRWMVLNFNDQPATQPQRLLLRVPKSIKLTIIKTASGDLAVSNGPHDKERFQTLRFQTASGDVNTGTAGIDSLELLTVSGNVNSQAEAKAIKVNSVSGDINAYSLEPKASVDIKTVSGDVQIGYHSKLNTKVSFISTSGELNLITKEVPVDRSADKETALVFGKGEGTVRVETISGNLEVL